MILETRRLTTTNISRGSGSREDLGLGHTPEGLHEITVRQFYEECHFLSCRSQSISHSMGKVSVLEGIIDWPVGMRIL